MPMCTCKGYVDVCPVTKEAWEARAKIANCGYKDVYHCLADSEGQKLEKCAQRTLIAEGNCPMFTTDGYLDWKPCNISEASCPNRSYVSNEVYKYSRCFGYNTPRNQTSNDIYHVHDGPSMALIIGIVASVVFLVLASVLICIALGFRRRKKIRRGRREFINIFEEGPLLPGTHNIGTSSGREIVRNSVNILREENLKCILVNGGLGNMVNSTAREILELYAMLEQWKSKEYQFSEVPDKIDEETIMFVYGWFGLWNDDLCSINNAKTLCKKLLKILETQNVKIIIGMRRDLYIKYMDELKEYSSLFRTEKIVDLSKDYLRDFVCCKISDCRCKDLTLAMLEGGGDELLGMPLKVEVISKHHHSDVINSYIKDKDILKAMKVHFTALEKNENPIYECLMYICLKGHFSRAELFDKDLVSKMKFGIKPSSFDELYVHLHRYTKVSISDEDIRYVFWHPFIYICAFHHLYEKDKSKIMNYCNVDAILQLVRPTTWEKKTRSSYIEVSADDEDVELFRKRFRELELDLRNKYKDHPLVEDASQRPSKDIEQ